MANFNAFFYLSGGGNADVETKSYAELEHIGASTNSPYLTWHCFISQLLERFFVRDYLAVLALCRRHPSPDHKRILHTWRTFYEGVACLSLARDTKQSKWRYIGEQAVEDMKEWALICPFNFNSRYRLLRAELLYSEGNLDAAKVFYEAAIESAQKQNFLNDEAVSCELYGIFLVETKEVDKGLVQLKVAVEKYREWGALRKVDELQQFIDGVELASYYRRATRPALVTSLD